MSSFRFLPPDKPTWKMHAYGTSLMERRGVIRYLRRGLYMSQLEEEAEFLRIENEHLSQYNIKNNESEVKCINNMKAAYTIINFCNVYTYTYSGYLKYRKAG